MLLITAFVSAQLLSYSLLCTLLLSVPKSQERQHLQLWVCDTYEILDCYHYIVKYEAPLYS